MDKKPGFAVALAIALLLNLLQLIATQVFLRKLAVVFPIDLENYALILCIQFATLVAAMTGAHFLRRYLSLGRLPVLVLAGGVILVCLKLTGPVAGSIAYFFAASLIQATLYHGIHAEFSAASIARLNIYVYTGAALGLLAGEKILFKNFSLTYLLDFLAVAYLILAAGIYIDGRRKTTAGVAVPSETLSGGVMPGFFSGFLLCSGLIIAFRLFRIYIRDSADIVAEITALGMLAGAGVSYLAARRPGLLAAPLQTVAGAAAILVFATFPQNLNGLTILPRELFILLPLVGLAGGSTYFFNAAFLSGKPTAVLVSNAWGSLAGALLMGYVVLPACKPRAAFALWLALAAFLVLAFSAYRWRGERRRPYRLLYIFSLSIFLPLILFSIFRGDWYETQVRSHAQKLVPHEEFVRSLDTPHDLWILTARKTSGGDAYQRLIYNSHSMSATNFPNRRYMKLMAYLGRFYAPEAATALNIGFGTGLTAQALLESKKLAQLDVVDISREVADLTAYIYQTEKTPNPLDDSRLRYFTGGARHLLQRQNKRYGIITGEPPPPSNSAIAYLYTSEFYELVLSRLEDGGVFTYWLPIHTVDPESAKRIWDTFCAVFPAADLFAGTETNLIMVGYKPTQRKAPWVRSELNWAHIGRETNLHSPADFFSLLLRTRAGGAVASLTDDFAYIGEGYAADWHGHAGLISVSAESQKSQVAVAVARRFEAAPPATLPALIYTADVSAEPYTSLTAAEYFIREAKKAGRKVPVNTLRAIFGLDYRSRSELLDPFVDLLAKGSYPAAETYVFSKQMNFPSREMAFAFHILVQRLSGVDDRQIQDEAGAFSRGGAMSPRFRNYIERKIELPGLTAAPSASR